MAKIYIRTDKNGTKIFHDYTCDRCGGAGGADAWKHTGWTCFKCGGTGTMEKPNVIKEYTDEYAKKLEEQRAKRAKKKFDELTAKAGEKNLEFFENQGFNNEGFCFVVLGNTYEIKEQLKAAGARFNSDLGWYFSAESSDYPTIKIHADEYFRKDIYGLYRWNDVNYGKVVDATIAKIKEANKSDENKSGEYFGTVGERIQLHLKYMRSFAWEASFNYRTDVQYLHTFEDEEGHVFVWKTAYPLWDSNYNRYEEGTELEIKATIKAHDEYKGMKQTALQRCKVL